MSVLTIDDDSHFNITEATAVYTIINAFTIGNWPAWNWSNVSDSVCRIALKGVAGFGLCAMTNEYIRVAIKS